MPGQIQTGPGANEDVVQFINTMTLVDPPGQPEQPEAQVDSTPEPATDEMSGEPMTIPTRPVTPVESTGATVGRRESMHTLDRLLGEVYELCECALQEAGRIARFDH